MSEKAEHERADVSDADLIRTYEDGARGISLGGLLSVWRLASARWGDCPGSSRLRAAYADGVGHATKQGTYGQAAHIEGLRCVHALGREAASSSRCKSLMLEHEEVEALKDWSFQLEQHDISDSAVRIGTGSTLLVGAMRKLAATVLVESGGRQKVALEEASEGAPSHTASEKPRPAVGRWCWSEDSGETYGPTFETGAEAIADARKTFEGVYQDFQPRWITLARVGEVVDAGTALCRAFDPADLLEHAEDYIRQNYGNEEDVIHYPSAALVSLRVKVEAAIRQWAAGPGVFANYYVVDADSVKELEISPDITPLVRDYVAKMKDETAKFRQILEASARDESSGLDDLELACRRFTDLLDVLAPKEPPSADV